MAKRFDIPKQGFSSVADAYNGLLGIDTTRVVDIPLSQLDEIDDQPFPINESKVDQIADSIENVGVIEPVIVVKNGERYSILSGRHRFRACQKLGKTEIPCYVKETDETTARYILIATNTDRNNEYSPIVYARAYAEQIELMKKLGKRSVVNAIAQQNGINRKQIYRYLRLNYLIAELQKWVEEKTLTIEAAVELSFLSDSKQLAIVEHINNLGIGDSVISKHFKAYTTKNIRSIGETMTDDKFIVNIDKIIFGNYGYQEEKEMGLQAPKTIPEIKQEPTAPESILDGDSSANDVSDTSSTEKAKESSKETNKKESPKVSTEKEMEPQAPKAMPKIKVIEGGRNTEPCSYCQNLFEGEGYSFGADFGDTEPSVTIYIRKHETAYDLVIESEKGNTSCRIAYCPKCGRYLDGGI